MLDYVSSFECYVNIKTMATTKKITPGCSEEQWRLFAYKEHNFSLQCYICSYISIVWLPFKHTDQLQRFAGKAYPVITFVPQSYPKRYFIYNHKAEVICIVLISQHTQFCSEDCGTQSSTTLRSRKKGTLPQTLCFREP